MIKVLNTYTRMDKPLLIYTDISPEFISGDMEMIFPLLVDSIQLGDYTNLLYLLSDLYNHQSIIALNEIRSMQKKIEDILVMLQESLPGIDITDLYLTEIRPLAPGLALIFDIDGRPRG